MSYSVREYKHLYKRVEYPMEGGYRIEPYQLPSWLVVEIRTNRDTNTKVCVVKSKIHTNKEVEMIPPYSADFTDEEVLEDLSGKIKRQFGITEVLVV